MPDQTPAAKRRRGAAHFSSRTKARKQALDILFQADLMGTDPLVVLREAQLDADPPLREYALDLVEGVAHRGGAIDKELELALDAGWSLDRMTRVDRCLARIATYEIIRELVPVRVAIAEALVLAGELSTDESPAFLNGVLSAIARERPMELEDVEAAHEQELVDAPVPASETSGLEDDETDE